MQRGRSVRRGLSRISVNPESNHDARWAQPVLDRFVRSWAGAPSVAELEAVLAGDFVFHWHHELVPGAAAFAEFQKRVRSHAPNLRMVLDATLSQGDLVVVYFHWASDRWHPDIVGAGDRSNFGKMVLRIAGDRIQELWEQAPDYLYLLGKGLPCTLMNYPAVAKGTVFLRTEAGLFPTADDQTIHLGELFRRMNDCFLGHCPISRIHEVQEPDIRFEFDGGRKHGQGVGLWKTFAYALRTASHDSKAIRFDDVFIREGNRLTIFSRSWIQYPSPFILSCANGMVAGLNFEASDSRPSRIQALHTFLENYLPFLDTDFGAHDVRIRELFQGRRRTVQQETCGAVPTPRAEPLPASTVQAGQHRREVAIIGIAGRFPGAASIDEFWRLIVEGRAAFSEFPEARAYLRKGTRIRHAALLSGEDRFDYEFFQTPALQAEYTDPQQRLLMEVIWHCLEDSGHRPQDVAGPRTGLFVSSLSEDFHKQLLERGAPVNGYSWLGNEPAMFPAKLARWLDVQGPCRFINAECASSLVALHEASRLIRGGEIDQAVVGATNLFFHSYGFAVREDSLLTREPAPRMFSRESQGQVRGEAVVAVLLKSLDRALEDGDSIYGIIAGSAVNSSGRTLSIVAPNVERQAEVIRAAWEDAGVAPEAVSLIECQASGVREGDFAELAAIRRALRTSGVARDAAGVCLLATVKGNVGHAEAASGLTAMVKLLLEIRHRTVAPIHGVDSIDPSLELQSGRLQAVLEKMPWKALESPGGPLPLIGGVNAFATGGYNAHVVVREHPQRRNSAVARTRRTPVLVVCSARTQRDLIESLGRLARYLADHPAADLEEVAYTLQVGRAPMAYRVATVVSDCADWIRWLRDVAENPSLHLPANPIVASVRESVTEPGLGRVTALIRAGQLEELGRLWMSGWHINWALVWEGRKVSRVSGLPSYPFAGPRLPIPEKGEPSLPIAEADSPTRCLSVVCSGQESFFRDHRVKGRSTLPAAVSLHWMLTGLADHFGVPRDRIRLEGVTWIRPCIADGSPVHLEVLVLGQPGGAGIVRLVRRGGVADAPELLCEGRARLSDHEGAPEWAVRLVRELPLESEGIPGEASYSCLLRSGMGYGPSYRTIRYLWRRKESVIASLELNTTGEEQGDAVAWHSSMVDGAIHSLVGFAADLDGSLPPGDGPTSIWAPFAMERVEFVRSCTQRMTAVLRVGTTSSVEAGSRVRKFDIVLLDAAGDLAVRLLGVSCRPVGTNPGAKPKPGAERSAPRATRDSVASEECVRFFTQQVATLLKIPAERVGADTLFTEFGMDSALAVALTRHLETILGPLSTTLFFECRSVRELAESLSLSHGEALRSVLRVPALMPGGRGAPIENAAAGSEGMKRTAEAAPAVGPLDIAIIGLAGRYPGARNVDEFWDNLCAGRDCITEIPDARWNHAALFDPDKNQPGKTYSKWGGFLDGVDEFDAKYFSISPWEAGMMDPQERLFLQCSMEVIEDAGYTRDTLAKGGRVGVYVGVMYGEYQLYGASETALGRPLALFSSPASIANRVSYICNFRGPSLALDTMCSSSLTAIHLACQSLLRGETNVALAGGVNLSIHPNKYLMLGQGRFVSSKGRCESFGEGAEGYVPGEGVGAVLLKPLAAALVDGDRIYGVVKGSAINHGGRNNGYTVPNPQSQAEVVEAALRESGVDPRTISYIEAHGTGTSLGDPIEIAGLKKVYGRESEATGWCAIGSVKSNIGHCESAAGIAGLTKVLLQMTHQTLVPSLHAGTLNRHIDFDQSPFRVQRGLSDWVRPEPSGVATASVVPLRAGLSSFGAGGSNAHLIVEEFQGTGSSAESADPESQVIVLSARTAAGLKQMAANLVQFLDRSSDWPSLRDVAFTLQVGREAMEHRVAFESDSLAHVLETLRALGSETPPLGVYHGQAKANDVVLSLFASDDQLKATLDAWLVQKRRAPLMELWVKGLRVEWSRLHSGRPRRIRLPAYPWARDRHWVSIGSGASNPAAASTLPSAPVPEPEFDDSFYETLLAQVDQGSLSVADAVVRERAHAARLNGRAGALSRRDLKS